MDFEDQMILAVRNAGEKGRKDASAAAWAYAQEADSEEKAREVMDGLRRRDPEVLEEADQAMDQIGAEAETQRPASVGIEPGFVDAYRELRAADAGLLGPERTPARRRRRPR